MVSRSVGSHQRTTLFLGTALAFSFSFIQPSVTVERRRLPSVGKASSINTPERVSYAQEGAFRGIHICSTRAYATDRMQGQNMVLNSCV
ncbi:hypothetical protein EDB89DRAFT_2022509 [Lactarius sanguifluus]|nr:hypothetical protein EDB89DRAFT_2022509 [Lactarius sanguifluus]